MNAKNTRLAALTGIGPVSRPGIGIAELVAAPSLDDDSCRVEVRELDNFEPAEFLGKRGWKFMPPATRVALAAVQLVLADAGTAPEQRAERTGVVVGTNFAVYQAVDQIDRALLADGIAGISPVLSPNFAVNVPVGNLSITHGMKAFNITLVNLLTAGYESLLLGAGALAAGRAETVLAGAVEGPPPDAFLTHTGQGADAGGACLLQMEDAEAARRRGARIYAVLTGGVRRTLPQDQRGTERVLGTALDRLDIRPADRFQLSVPAGKDGLRAEEAIRGWADRRGARGAVTVTRGAPQASVTSMLALARQLARPAEGTAAGPDDRGLVCTALGPQGNVVLLRLAPAGILQ
ncbi:beta-ketoacyl synthase N-terminal-like domain-containing protein [Streptomyces sp. NPDC002586]|uniref:beta-ketoacyl synthase N-terminal-like domain-containing protein n=1 Tax=Streptomyces sp. NPDC002589 TaxID=3154420 RepID=UPI00332B9F03